MMKKNVETELKLLIDKKDLKKLLASDLLQSVIRKSSDRTVQMCSSYYDTAQRTEIQKTGKLQDMEY